jgi:hypothetical protein
MATAFTAATPGATAVLCTGVAVSATGDTLNGNDLLNGARLIVTCAATPSTVGFVDPGRTPAGTVAGTVTGTVVAANTSRAFGRTQLAGYIDPITGLVGVTYTSVTNCTAMFVG